MYSAANRTITDNSLSCSFRLSLCRAKCGTKPRRLLISFRHYTTSAQHSAKFIRGRMYASPTWRHACMFAKHGKQTDIARTPAFHNAASQRKKRKNEKGATPAWKRARTTHKLKTKSATYGTWAAAYRQIITCSQQQRTPALLRPPYSPSTDSLKSTGGWVGNQPVYHNLNLSRWRCFSLLCVLRLLVSNQRD